LAEEVQATPDVPAQAHGDLDAIAHQADRLRRMVGQLLAMSRLESGALIPRTDVFRVEPLIERTWAALRADRPFDLVATSTPYLAVGDPDRLEQALWAILDNAVKYSAAGRPVHVRVAPSARTLTISVEDQGGGMDEETQGRAFEQFFRASGARVTAPDGSGIGLYTARGLLRAMGGDITVTSQPSIGSTFSLTMPAEPAGSA
jgi:signal transduction histidine kinase